MSIITSVHILDSALSDQLAPFEKDFLPDCRKFCLAARIQNGVLSPPTAPRTWSDQIESINKHCDPSAKEGLIECLEKIEKFKTDHLDDILLLKRSRKELPKAFDNAIRKLNSPAFEELVHHLISQPFPEKPIEFTAKKNEFTTDEIPSFFFSVLNKIAATAISQGLGHSKNTVQQQKIEWRNEVDAYGYSTNYTMHPIEITLKGNKIRGTYFKYRHAFEKENRPTVICCNPSGGIYMCFGWMFDFELAKFTKGYDFISFDTRGCGDSTGFPSGSSDLYSDTDCVYQFVRDELKVKPNKIHFFGYSLGGNLCANVKAVHPECKGRMVIDRSFSLLSHVIENLCRRLPVIMVIFFVPAFLGPILAKIVSLIGWEMEGQDAADKAKGKKLIVHHPEDKMIGMANLQTEKKGFQYLDLRRYQQESEAPIHQSSLYNFDSTEGTAEAKVAEFLFNAPR